MPPADNLSHLKKIHDKLSSIFEKENSTGAPFSGDPNRQRNFLRVVQKLLEAIKRAPHVETQRDYSWLNDVIGKWQLRCHLLGYNVYVPILAPPERFRGNGLKYDAIEDFVRRKADEISITRRLIKARVKAEEAYNEWTLEEEKIDWAHAQLYFATDVLYGRGDEWKQLDPDFIGPGDLWRYFTHDTFLWLEKVLLRDVLRLRAYEIWVKDKKRKITSVIKDMDEDYFKAVADFRSLLSDDSTKKPVSDEARQMLIAFVQQRYFVDGGELYEAKEEVRNLIRATEHRMIQDDVNAFRARRLANNYIRMFYSNVVGALQGNGDCKKKLVGAFEDSERSGEKTSIINCFEAAILRHYVTGLGPIFRAREEGTAHNV
jgi:hypothetical protein